MAFVTIDSQFVNFDPVSKALAESMNKLPILTAISMTKGVLAGRQAIKDKIFPLIEGGPSPWTRRGLIYSKATPKDLRAQVGFNYGEGRFEDDYSTPKAGGVPSGRYMRTNTRGGDRPAKSSELQLWRSGTLRRNKDFLVPNPNLREINAQGNLPGRSYQSAIAGVGGFNAPGSGQNVTKQTSKKKKKGPKYQFFLLSKRESRFGEMSYAKKFTGEEKPYAIVRRVGYRLRGFEPVLFVTDQQNYERRFPVDKVAYDAFKKQFYYSFKELVNEAWLRKNAKLYKPE